MKEFELKSGTCRYPEEHLVKNLFTSSIPSSSKIHSRLIGTIDMGVHRASLDVKLTRSGRNVAFGPIPHCPPCSMA
jgi:hypothetical protein